MSAEDEALFVSDSSPVRREAEFLLEHPEVLDRIIEALESDEEAEDWD